MTNRPLTLPPRAGVGFKPQHFDAIEATRPNIGFFEVHAENYMGDGGPPHRRLEAIRADYPLSLHGVGLSIGSPGRLDRAHLARLKTLIRRYQPRLFSEHLAWSSHGDGFLADLLPLPLTEETLNLVIDHVDEAQAALGVRMLIENPSTYLVFADSAIAENQFLAEVAGRTGCGLLLDVANVFVSSVNHGFDPRRYLDGFSFDRVEEIHLAGCFDSLDDSGRRLLIDAHDSPVREAVWSLYAQAIARGGAKPTLIEWDNDLPDWRTLEAQAGRADDVAAEAQRQAGRHAA